MSEQDPDREPEYTEEEKRRLESKFGWKAGDVTIRQPPPKPLKPIKE